MKTKTAVRAEINSLGRSGLFLVGKELKNLHQYLNSDEKILALMSGFEGPTSVLVVLTNARIMFLDKNLIVGSNHRDIPLRRLTSTEGNKRLFFANLTFYEGTRCNKVAYISKRAFSKFTQVLSSALAKNGRDNVDAFVKEIEKLGTLVDKGLLTKAEFEKKKQALLGE